MQSDQFFYGFGAAPAVVIPDFPGDVDAPPGAALVLQDDEIQQEAELTHDTSPVDPQAAAQGAVGEEPNQKKRARGYRNVKGGACDYCKKRHARCDGKLPCSLCIAKGETCIFSTKPNKRRKTTENGAEPEAQPFKAVEAPLPTLRMDASLFAANVTAAARFTPPSLPLPPTSQPLHFPEDNHRFAQMSNVIEVLWNVMRHSNNVGVQEYRYSQYIVAFSKFVLPLFPSFKIDRVHKIHALKSAELTINADGMPQYNRPALARPGGTSSRSAQPGGSVAIQRGAGFQLESMMAKLPTGGEAALDLHLSLTEYWLIFAHGAQLIGDIESAEVYTSEADKAIRTIIANFASRVRNAHLDRLLACCILLTRIYASQGKPECSEFPLRSALSIFETKPAHVYVPPHLVRSIYAAMAFGDESEEWPAKALQFGSEAATFWDKTVVCYLMAKVITYAGRRYSKALILTLYEMTCAIMDDILKSDANLSQHFTAFATRAVFSTVMNRKEEAHYFARRALDTLFSVVPDGDFGTTSTIGFIYKVGSSLKDEGLKRQALDLLEFRRSSYPLIDYWLNTGEILTIDFWADSPPEVSAETKPLPELPHWTTPYSHEPWRYEAHALASSLPWKPASAAVGSHTPMQTPQADHHPLDIAAAILSAAAETPPSSDSLSSTSPRSGEEDSPLAPQLPPQEAPPAAVPSLDPFELDLSGSAEIRFW